MVRITNGRFLALSFHFISQVVFLGTAVADPDGVVPPPGGHGESPGGAGVAHALPAAATMVDLQLGVELLLTDHTVRDLSIGHPVCGASRVLQHILTQIKKEC